MFVCLWTKVGFCLSGVPPSQFCLSCGIMDKGKGGKGKRGIGAKEEKGEKKKSGKKGQGEKREKGERGK
jgi:hypothetical protein